MISTPSFNPVDDTKLLCTCGHDDCDRRSVSQEHLNRCQRVRDIVGPLSVTSGGRCPNHSSEIDRKTPADHQKGYGLDVSCDGYDRGMIVKAAIDVGFNAIGVAKTFVHLGYRPELPESHITMWVY